MDDAIRHILTTTRRIAVVGASQKPDRAGNYVMAFLIARGFEVTGVNPGLAGQALHGRPVVATLAEAGPLELVDVFRAPDQVGPVVDEAIRAGARTIWDAIGCYQRAAAAAARGCRAGRGDGPMPHDRVAPPQSPGADRNYLNQGSFRTNCFPVASDEEATITSRDPYP